MKGVESVSLVREQSDQKIYLVVGDTKFLITDQAEFDALGFDQGKIRTVDDGTLESYREKLLHPPVALRPSDVFFDCGTDWSDPLAGNFYWNCKSSANLVQRDVLLAGNVLVAGWLIQDPNNQSHDVPQKVNFPGPAAQGIEDLFYDLALDAVFIERMYGPDGLSTLLLGAVWPGNPPASPMTFGTGPPGPGGAPSAILGSFNLPQGVAGGIHVELNAWHVSTTGDFGHNHFVGRGPAPAGWISPFQSDPTAFFPFQPSDPEGTGEPLQTGDYVVMRGALWEDVAHLTGAPDPWVDPVVGGKNGWQEIHPPDWIVRVAPPSANLRLTPLMVTLTNGPPGTVTYGGGVISPDFTDNPGRTLKVRSVEYVVDPVTYAFNGSIGTVPPQASPPPAQPPWAPYSDYSQVEVTVSVPWQPLALFKADWLVGWSEVGTLDTAWVDDAVPPGAGMGVDGGDSWDWVTSNVFFGTQAHVSALADGEHQHWFEGASQPMTVAGTDTLFAMVYLDPDNPPHEVMLQWHVLPDTWCRAYWGDNLINWGTDGTPDRQNIGHLPPAGEWVRLEVPASDLALGTGGQPSSVDGMAFTLYGGTAIWDYAGVSPPFTPPPAPVIPDVLNKTAAEAEQAIEAAGFTAQIRFTKDPDGKHLGLVLSESPPGGTTSTAGAVVTIYIGTDSE